MITVAVVEWARSNSTHDSSTKLEFDEIRRLLYWIDSCQESDSHIRSWKSKYRRALLMSKECELQVWVWSLSRLGLRNKVRFQRNRTFVQSCYAGGVDQSAFRTNLWWVQTPIPTGLIGGILCESHFIHLRFRLLEHQISRRAYQVSPLLLQSKPIVFSHLIGLESAQATVPVIEVDIITSNFGQST
jgi:hypothetical protein